MFMRYICIKKSWEPTISPKLRTLAGGILGPCSQQLLAMITSSPRFTWCDCRKHKIHVKDTNELCLQCLGIQHAKEAVLEYGKCPQCAKMDWSNCINRLTKVQEIMHHESQQRKHEAALSEVKLKSETTSAPIKEPKLEEDPVPILPPPRPSTTTPVYSSTMPVLFTILSPHPAQTGPNSSIPKDTFLSQLAIQQSADHPIHEPIRFPHADFQGSANNTISQNAARTAPSTSNGAVVASGGDALHLPRLPPPTDFCSSGKWRRSQRESRQAVRSERRHREQVEMVQQRLEAQQQATQLQWAVLEKCIEALERKGAEAVVSFPTSAQTTHLHASIPQASTLSQESEQRDLSPIPL
ncbi:uncharacterized protein LOC120021205 isoform X1 [Salvelinus namaycush]|uniref:Uncharacterized protein LOC120021205 isoform X1 n=1 Tax=Salvelinus namaycush TaxID=8040 RepID=A0A8U0P9G4_SALNM|nr:uncharacterized protein LOC120021205 isoform X1 [Salvelinus namaycush]